MVGISHFLLVASLVVLETSAAVPDLYYWPASPPSRIALMTTKVLRMDVNYIPVNIKKGEQLTPEFRKMNPQHTVPTLNDNGFVLSESRAIQAYLCDTNPNGEKIYPRDLKKRALIEQMLYFDIGRLYQGFYNLYRPMMLGKPYDEGAAKFFDEGLEMFEEYLSRSEWAAGDEMTIADIALLSTVTTAEAVGHDIGKWSKISSWLAKTKAAIPDYEMANQEGVNIWKGMFADIKKN